MAAASPGLKPAQDGNRDTGCHGHQIFSAGEEGGTSPGGKEGAFTWMGALPHENWAIGKLGLKVASMHRTGPDQWQENATPSAICRG